MRLALAHVLALVLFFTVSSPSWASGQPEPFLWTTDLVSAEGVTPVDHPIWAGNKAWDDREAVAQEIEARLEAGGVPYIYFYQWGHDLWSWSTVSATRLQDWEDWALHLANAIGSDLAYVVVEPEWDIDPSSGISPSFKAALERVLDVFRARAPGAVLVNGPGFWQDDAYYEAFADVAALFDVQGFLHHVISEDADCTWRVGGPSWVEAMSYEEALDIVAAVRAKAQRASRLFESDRVMLTDLGVTRCGWGAEGQREIVARLVDGLPELYQDLGLRGVTLRYDAPAPEGRDMGHNNEGMFSYEGQPAEAEVARGIEVLERVLSSTEALPTTAARRSQVAPRR